MVRGVFGECGSVVPGQWFQVFGECESVGLGSNLFAKMSLFSKDVPFFRLGGTYYSAHSMVLKRCLGKRKKREFERECT